MSQIYLETRKRYCIPFISLKTNIIENFGFVFLKEDIHRYISSTKPILSDIKGLRYADLKRVNFFVGHPVYLGVIKHPV